ncbi:MAG TPA: hypothetical protein VJV78_10200 [Polyangiales bacterium]|nr:hypothetical protein [Polyangiales bacterium]
MMRKLGFGLGLLLVAAWLGAPARAATLLALDLSQLVEMSDFVVLGKAQSRASRKVDSGMIVTDVRLQVVTALKGAVKAGAPLTATLAGGEIGDLALTVPGEAVIPDDQGAIVFLRKNERGELNVTGMSQGVMRVSGVGKTAQVLPGGSGAALVQQGNDGKLRDAPDALLQPRGLGEVLAEIRRLAAK